MSTYILHYVHLTYTMIYYGDGFNYYSTYLYT